MSKTPPTVAELLQRIEENEKSTAALGARLEKSEQENAKMAAQLKSMKPAKTPSELEQKQAKLAQVPQPQRTCDAAGYKGPHVAVPFVRAGEVLALVPDAALAAKARSIGMYNDAAGRKLAVITCDEAAFKALAEQADKAKAGRS